MILESDLGADQQFSLNCLKLLPADVSSGYVHEKAQLEQGVQGGSRTWPAVDTGC